MPFADGSIDVVLCTQVLEHIKQPGAVIAEIWRILKPGATLLLSVPGIFPQHGYPGDYWRYMPQGLEWLLRDFERVDVRAEAGTLSSVFLVLNMYLFMFSAWSSLFQKLLSWTVYPVSNLLGLLVGKIHRGKQFASNYFVVAVR
jgi:SAM-dependent methyltransferase